jgi:hypothetical protein
METVAQGLLSIIESGSLSEEEQGKAKKLLQQMNSQNLIPAAVKEQVKAQLEG